MCQRVHGKFLLLSGKARRGEARRRSDRSRRGKMEVKLTSAVAASGVQSRPKVPYGRMHVGGARTHGGASSGASLRAGAGNTDGDDPLLSPPLMPTTPASIVGGGVASTSAAAGLPPGAGRPRLPSWAQGMPVVSLGRAAARGAGAAGGGKGDGQRLPQSPGRSGEEPSAM